MKDNNLLIEELKNKLPPKLSEEEYNKVIRNIRNGINVKKMKCKLVESNIYIVLDICKKYEKYFFSINDAISIGTLGLIKAVNILNYEGEIQLVTNISRYVENEIVNFLKEAV